MSQNNQKSSVVESSVTCAPEYMIINHPVHGRIFMREGKANVMHPFNWADGLAFSCKPADTLESLENEEWNEGMNLMEACLYGVDDSRPILDWEGFMLEQMALSAIGNSKNEA